MKKEINKKCCSCFQSMNNAATAAEAQYVFSHIYNLQPRCSVCLRQWKYCISVFILEWKHCKQWVYTSWRVGYDECCVDLFFSPFVVLLWSGWCVWFGYWSGLRDPPPCHPEATVITDLVSFVSPSLVHSIGPLGGEHRHVVPIGLGNKGLLQRVHSQTGACVSLLVAKWWEGKIQREIHNFSFFFLL